MVDKRKEIFHQYNLSKTKILTVETINGILTVEVGQWRGNNYNVLHKRELAEIDIKEMIANE